MRSLGVDAHARGRAATSASGSRRGRQPSSSAFATSPPTTSTRTSFAWSLRARLAPRGSRATSISTSRARPSETPTGATSTGARAGPWTRPSKFLGRYLLDTLDRIKTFQRVRAPARTAQVLHEDAQHVALDGRFDGLLTSPPYPGLIDYHEQHRYAYELLGLDDRRERELGAAARGTSRAALRDYSAGILGVLRNCLPALADDAPVIIVVNDRRDVYPQLLEDAGLKVVERLERHVNRRTGRRAGEYYESIFVTSRSGYLRA